MEVELQRRHTLIDTTFGDLSIVGKPFVCFTKEPGRAAVRPGIYEIILENGPKFGVETMTLAYVRGHLPVGIHSGERGTDGIIVGDQIDAKRRTISGGSAVIAALKAIVVPAIRRRERVFIDIKNPESEMELEP